MFSLGPVCSTKSNFLRAVGLFLLFVHPGQAQSLPEDDQGIHHLIHLLNQRLEGSESSFTSQEEPPAYAEPPSWWWSYGTKPEGVKKANNAGVSTLRIMKKAFNRPQETAPFPYDSIRIMKKASSRIPLSGKLDNRHYDSLRVMKREPNQSLRGSVDLPDSLRIMKKDTGPYHHLNLQDSLRIMKKNVENMEEYMEGAPSGGTPALFNRPSVRSGNWNTDLRIL